MIYLATVFRSEVQRYFRSSWSKVGENLSWFLYLVLIFIAAVAILGGLQGSVLGSQDQLLVLVGWLAWIVASDCMSELPQAVSEEAQAGTLEQLCLSPLPLWFILAVRSLAYLVGVGIRGLIAAVILFFFVAPPESIPSLILIFLISLVGAYGLGFIFAGLALVIKRVEALTGVIFSLMIFATGALVGLERLGVWYQLLKLGLPMTWGISLMREVVQGTRFLELWSNGEVIGVIIQSFVCLLLGLAVFTWGFRQAQAKGTLGQY